MTTKKPRKNPTPPKPRSYRIRKFNPPKLCRNCMMNINIEGFEPYCNYHRMDIFRIEKCRNSMTRSEYIKKSAEIRESNIIRRPCRNNLNTEIENTEEETDINEGDDDAN